MSTTTPTPVALMAFFAGLLAAFVTALWLHRFPAWRTGALRYLAGGLGAIAFALTFWLFIAVSNGVTR